MSSIFRPSKNDPPLVVHPNTVKSLMASFQGFKTISGWDSQVLQAMRCVDHIQFSQSYPKDFRRKPADPLSLSAVEQVFRCWISERFDHPTLFG